MVSARDSYPRAACGPHAPLLSDTVGTTEETALWQNILEHNVCGLCVCACVCFFFLLNKWMCLGVASKAEAPPTHLEALNSLKGPGVWRLERERPLSSLCGKASSGPCWAFIWLHWLCLQWGYLRKVGGGEASLPALSFPRLSHSASCSKQQDPGPLNTLCLELSSTH